MASGVCAFHEEGTGEVKMVTPRGLSLRLGSCGGCSSFAWVCDKLGVMDTRYVVSVHVLKLQR